MKVEVMIKVRVKVDPFNGASTVEVGELRPLVRIWEFTLPLKRIDSPRCRRFTSHFDVYHASCIREYLPNFVSDFMDVDEFILSRVVGSLSPISLVELSPLSPHLDSIPPQNSGFVKILNEEGSVRLRMPRD
jgi:hypothetical protein